MALEEEDLRIDASWNSDITEGALEDAAAVKAFDKAVRQNEKSLKRNDKVMSELTAEINKHRDALRRGVITQAEFDDHLRRIEKRMHGVRTASAKLSDAIHNGRTRLREWNKDLEYTHHTLYRIERLLTGGGGGGRIGQGIVRLGGAFQKLGGYAGAALRTIKMGLMPAAIIGGIPLILRGLTALGGGIVALASKWSQMSGLALALPAAFATAAGAMGTLMLAVKGLDEQTKKFLATWGKGLQKVASKAVFSPKTIRSIKEMTEALNPTLKGGLRGMGRVWGRVIQDITKELSRGKTKNILADILGTKKGSTDGIIQQMKTLGTAAVPGLKLLLKLIQAGQPVLKMMSDDMTKMIKGFGFDKGDATSFMKRAYETFKEAGRTISNFVKGLVNIGKIGKNLGGDMTKSLEQISKKFLDWTTSPEGQKSITQFFADLKPVLKELAAWVPAIASGLKSITSSNGDFIKVSQWMRTQALPVIVDIWSQLKDKMVPIAEAVWDSMKAIGDSAIGAGAVWAIQTGANAVRTVIEAMAKLPGGPALMAAAGAFLAFRTLLGALGLGKLPLGLTSGLLGVGGGSKVAAMQVGVLNAGVLNAGVPGVGGVPAGGGKGGKGGGGSAFFNKGRAGAAGRGAGLWGGIKGAWGSMGAVGKGLVGASILFGTADVASKIWSSARDGEDPGVMGTLGGAASGAFAGAAIGSIVPGIGTAIGAITGGIVGAAGPWIGKWAHDLTSDTIAEAERAKKVTAYENAVAAAAAKDRARIAQNEANKGLSGQKDYQRYFQDNGSARTRPLTDAEWAKLQALQRGAGLGMRGTKNALAEAQYGTLADRRADRTAHGYDNTRAGVAAWRQSRQASFNAARASQAVGVPQGMQTYGQVPTYGKVAEGLAAKVTTADDKLKAFKAKLDAMTFQPSVVDLQVRITYNELNTPPPNVPSQRPTGTTGRGGTGYVPVKPTFTGGPTAGGIHLVGEQGPELWMGRSGGMKMLGANGPEVLRLGPGAVINAEATRDPFTSRPGLTPAWALEALQKATVQQAASQAVGQAAGGLGGTLEAHVTFGDIYPASGIDLENSIRRGITKAARDRAERS